MEKNIKNKIISLVLDYAKAFHEGRVADCGDIEDKIERLREILNDQYTDMRKSLFEEALQILEQLENISSKLEVKKKTKVKTVHKWICFLCGAKSFSTKKPISCSGSGNALGCDGGHWRKLSNFKKK